MGAFTLQFQDHFDNAVIDGGSTAGPGSSLSESGTSLTLTSGAGDQWGNLFFNNEAPRFWYFFGESVTIIRRFQWRITGLDSPLSNSFISGAWAGNDGAGVASRVYRFGYKYDGTLKLYLERVYTGLFEFVAQVSGISAPGTGSSAHLLRIYHNRTATTVPLPEDGFSLAGGGNRVAFYYSFDNGASWTQLHSETVSMFGTIDYAGLFSANYGAGPSFVTADYQQHYEWDAAASEEPPPPEEEESTVTVAYATPAAEIVRRSASMATRPRPSRYLRPGAYLGQVFRPRPTTVAEVTFRPAYIGKGNRLALAKNASVPRSWVEGEELSFTAVPPFIATLSYPAVNDRVPPVSLYDQDGNEVSTKKWQFQESTPNSGTFNQVLFNTADYDPMKTYYLDFQSASRSVLDPLPFQDPRKIIRIGLFPNQDLFVENLTPADESAQGDFVLPGAVGSFSYPTSNSNTATAVSTITAIETGTGSVSFGASNAPTNAYTKFYRLTVTAISAGPPKSVTFKLESWIHSGGNNAGHQVPLGSGIADKTFTVEEAGTGNTLDTNRQLIDGIYLSFAFGATNFVVSDVFRWFSYGPAKFEEHSAYDTANSQFASISTPAAAGKTTYSNHPISTADNTSVSSFAVGSTALYTGSFVRHFRLECSAFAGTAASGSLTYTLASISDNEHFTLSDGVASVTFEFQKTGGYTAVSGRTTIDITTAATDSDVATAAAAAINASALAVTAVPALGVVTVTNDNNGAAGNQTITAFEANGTTASTGIAVSGMSGGNRTATIVWGATDEMPYTSGSFALSETTASSYTNVSLEAGVKLTVVWGSIASPPGFVVGDTWTFVARPGRMYYFAKDDRIYTLTTTAASGLVVSGTYASSTIEGGFGTFSTTLADNGSGGTIALSDNVNFRVRNAGNAAGLPTGINAPNRHVAGNVTTFAATNDDVIKWDIDRRITETVAASGIIYDAIGAVTGVPGTYYLVLDHTPTSIISVRNADTLADISYTQVTASPYIYFATDPAVSVAVKYQHRGSEPNPGQTYYVSGTRLRAETEYDTAMLWRTLDNAKDGLQPSAVGNDILIASEIGVDAGNLQEWYTVQVRDLDDDGIYQTSDYKRAIQASELTPGITDRCVLNRFSALGTALQSTENCNDMFNFPSKFALLWVGLPANTPMGDENVADSIIYTSKRTLQVSGNSPSHGAHILIGNTWAKREVVLDDGSTTSVTLDGSFIAAAAMAKQCGFSDAAETLLFKTLGGVFTEMQAFSEAEALTLGGANITYLSERGDGIFRFEEDITTDPSAIDYLQINAMKQKQFVIRNLTKTVGERLTGFVPPDPYAAITLIRSFISETLSNYVAAGIIAPYGSEQNPPVRRPINPSKDVIVYQDQTIRTDWFFVTFFNLRYPIKRISGLFGVDSDEVLKGFSQVV